MAKMAIAFRRQHHLDARFGAYKDVCVELSEAGVSFFVSQLFSSTSTICMLPIS